MYTNFIVGKKKYIRGTERFSCYCGCEFYAFRYCDLALKGSPNSLL